MTTTNQPAPCGQPLLLRSRALAAFAGAYTQQRPLPVLQNGRVVWAITTAMTVSQLKLLYQQSGLAHAALELHVDMSNDIKTQKRK